MVIGVPVRLFVWLNIGRNTPNPVPGVISSTVAITENQVTFIWIVITESVNGTEMTMPLAD